MLSSRMNNKHYSKAVVIYQFEPGGFADVYLMKRKDCKELFVLKKIRKKLNCLQYFDKNARKIKLRDIILKEFYTGAALNHKNIIKTIDYDITHRSIVLEYFHGDDLFNILSSETKKTKKYLFVYEQLLDAIQYMHHLGIAHMDVKLENILVNVSSKTMKLIDFGQSCVFKIGNSKENIKYKDFKGTDTYIAPEMCQNLEYDPEKIDIWCCGIVLYNIVYNKLPWMLADEEKDLNYNLFVRFYKAGFFNTSLFPSLNGAQLGYNTSESDIINTIFWYTLNPNPIHRLSIAKLKTRFDKLTLY